MDEIKENENVTTADVTKTKAVSDNIKEVDFDDLLSSAGKFGRYQLFLFLSTCPFYTFGTFMYYQQIFLTETPQNHWCWIPELENMTDIERRNMAVPPDRSYLGYSRCRAYDANWTEVLLTGIRPNITWNTTPCQHGWEFNKTEIPYPTISSELEWVCDKNSYQATAQAIFFLGSMIGGVTFGWVADRFGRIAAAVCSNLVGCVGGVISIYASNFTEFALYRFFMGFSYDNCMMMVYLLILEYVAPKFRSFMANASLSIFYSLALTSMPWIALASGHWKTFSLVTSVPLILALLTPFVIPESPRWLLARGRIDEAVNKVKKIGQVNKREIPDKLIEQFTASARKTKEEKKGNIFDLLKRPVLRKMLIYLCVQYICCTLAFDATVRSIGQLDFDFFVSFSVVSVTEIPSMLLLAFVMDRLGRRWLSAIAMVISSVFVVLIVFINNDLLEVMCAVIVRFFLNLVYGVAMQWGAEALPTSVRGTGVSIIHICGFIGTILSPYVVYLDNYMYGLPMILTGLFCVLGAVMSLLLPETARKDMPQTYDDSENLYMSQRFWEMPCCAKNEKK